MPSVCTAEPSAVSLKGNSINSNSWLLWSDINSEFGGDDSRRVKYKIEPLTLGQKFLFQIKENVYLGGQAVYKNVEYSPNNEAGEDFFNLRIATQK